MIEGKSAFECPIAEDGKETMRLILLKRNKTQVILSTM